MEKKQEEVFSLGGFIKYLKHPQQYKEISIVLFAYVLLYIVFVNLYPLPSTLQDSASYVFCAQTHHQSGYRPYGYSQYLNFVHHFSSSVGFVTVTQFLLTALSTLFFIYTIKYFFKVQSNFLWHGFITLTVLALPTLFMAHSLMSDSLFSTLTVLWFTTGIWILFTRNLAMYAIHLLTLYWALEVRYSGLFYPAFTVLIIFLSFNKLTYKLGLTAACLIVTIYFYKSTVSDMKRDFGVEIFSGFSGWQLANNALHVVPYVEIEPQQARDPQTRAFLEFIKQSDKSVYSKEVSASFMWKKEGPLKQYAFWKMQQMQTDYLHSWLLCGEDFSKYGSYLIKKYPIAFFNHYLFPNALNILYPSSAGGMIVGSSDLKVDDSLHSYYGLVKGTNFSDGRSTLFINILPLLSITNLILWIMFLSSIVVLIFHREVLMQEKERFNCCLFLVLFAIGYAGFAAFAGPFEYRYIIPIRPILVLLPWLAISTMIMANKNLKKSNAKQKLD